MHDASQRQSEGMSTTSSRGVRKRYQVHALIDLHAADPLTLILGVTNDWELARKAAHRHASSWFGHYLLEGASITTWMEDDDGDDFAGTVSQLPPQCPACEWTSRSVSPRRWMPGWVHGRRFDIAHRDVLPAWNHLQELPGSTYQPWWLLPWQVSEWPADEVAYREARRHGGRPLRDFDAGLPTYMEADESAVRPV